VVLDELDLLCLILERQKGWPASVVGISDPTSARA
jgi:hypothetical protein